MSTVEERLAAKLGAGAGDGRPARRNDMRKRLNPRAIAAAAKAVWEYRNPTCPWRRAPSLWRRRYLASSRKALEAALRVLDGAREPLHK